ncbi:type I restriction-modification enzyme R subunit C-terminal domain-containing protein [Hoeflea sp.]|uniref:type I restriction-modification enzyme R subunit C-terminal domain-containing protein n=1 Tax=Hoeflea sp. TaxID=1940281 RepID=UPI0032EB1241
MRRAPAHRYWRRVRAGHLKTVWTGPGSGIALISENWRERGSQVRPRRLGEVVFARFKRKARHFLREHEDHIVFAKLRFGKPLTPTDITELEQMLLAAEIGGSEHIERASEIAHGLVPFLRSLVCLDRTRSQMPSATSFPTRPPAPT